MKRIIAFLVLLTVPIGFLTGAHKTVNAIEDDVTVTPYLVYGDPKRVEGVTFQMQTTCGYHIWWDTNHTPGDPGETQTAFHFSQEGHGFFDPNHDWTDFQLNFTGGMGMSTSGGDGLTFADEGIGVLINAVAEQTAPGESREVDVLLEDYYDYYPLDYWAQMHTDDFYLDEHYDTTQSARSQDNWEETTWGSYEQWTQHFKFPIQPGEKVTVSAWKDETGALREIGVNMIGNDTGVGANIGFSYILLNEGMYFSPVFQDGEGNVLESGEYVYGHGLYFIPFKPVPAVESTPTWVTFDFDRLEMVYSLESSDRLIAMEKSADGKQLHLLANQNGKYIYCLFDIYSRQLLTKTEILETKAESHWAFYPEQELLYLLAGGQVALVRMGEAAQVEFVALWPEEVRWIVPSAVRYEDGVLYGTSLEWYEDEGRGVCLIACDAEGLGYMGYYISNLDGTGYNGAWMNLENAAFPTA